MTHRQDWLAGGGKRAELERAPDNRLFLEIQGHGVALLKETDIDKAALLALDIADGKSFEVSTLSWAHLQKGGITAEKTALDYVEKQLGTYQKIRQEFEADTKNGRSYGMSYDDLGLAKFGKIVKVNPDGSYNLRDGRALTAEEQKMFLEHKLPQGYTVTMTEEGYLNYVKHKERNLLAVKALLLRKGAKLGSTPNDRAKELIDEASKNQFVRIRFANGTFEKVDSDAPVSIGQTSSDEPVSASAAF